MDPDGKLARLLHKYEALAALRRDRAAGEPIPDKSVFRALAGEFPGVLYELDRVPLEDIDGRRAALAAALSGGPIAAWMPAMATYHALYRAALYVKIRVKIRAARGALPGPAEAAALALAAGKHASIDVGAAFVTAVARPENGRIGPIVIAETAARAGARPEDLQSALFPARRAPSVAMGPQVHALAAVDESGDD
jgi:hypothetical protein